MSELDQIGFDGMTKISTGTVYSKRDGRTVVRVYRGPIDKAEILFNQFKSDFLVDDVQIARESGIGTVSVCQADDLNSVTDQSIWELGGERMLKDIRTHQSFNQSADQDAIEIARVAAELGEKITPVAGAATTYYGLRRRGTQEYLRSQPVLRQSIRTSQRGSIVVSWAGVDRAWKLQGESGSPGPPLNLVGTINNMPEADGNKKQWLKMAPQLTQVTSRLWQINFEWIFARQWSNTLYEGTAGTDNP